MRWFVSVVVSFGTLTGSAATLSASSDSLTHLLNLVKDERLTECLRYVNDSDTNFATTADVLYLTAVCALRANRPFLARRQLNKLLERYPQYPGAWFTEAQADYLLHDKAALAISRAALKSAALPPQQQTEAKQWLESLDDSDHRHLVSLSGDVGAGHTSNANSGSAGSDYLGTPIPTLYRQAASDFSEASIGIVGAHALGSFQDLLGAARVFRRSYFDAPFVNQTLVAAAVSYRRPFHDWSAEYSISGFDERIAGIPQRRFGALEFAAARRVSDLWELSVVGRAGRLDYRIATRPDFDVWRFFWNANVSRLVGKTLKNRVGAGTYGGGDESVIRDSAYGNSRLGVRAFADYQLGAHFTVSAEAALSVAQFDGNGTFGGVRRLDKQSSLVAIGNWKWNPASRWSIQARAIHQNVNSNVSVFLFDQNELGIYVRLQDK